MPLKEAYKEKGIRVVSGATASIGMLYISAGTILIAEANVNIGLRRWRYLVDTWATVGELCSNGKTYILVAALAFAVF